MSLYFDQANAFASPTHSCLQRMLRERCKSTSDYKLMKSRHLEAMVTVDCIEGSLTLAPQSRTLQGDGVACTQFSAVFDPAAEEWLKQVRQKYKMIDFQSPFCNNVEVGLQVYADDIHLAVSCVEDTDSIVKQVNDISTMQDVCLQPRGLYQNKDKMEAQYRTFGPKSLARMKKLQGAASSSQED